VVFIIMDILITESQQKLLITEGVGETLQKLYSGTIDYSADLYQRVLKRLGINFKILLTFSSMIGAITRPLEEFLRGKFPTLNEDEILLLLIGTISILYFENKELLKEVLGRIKSLGIESELKTAVQKTKSLESSFRKFLGNTVKGLSFTSDVIAYTYMIPLLGYLVNAFQGHTFSPEEIELLITRLSAIGIFHISTEMLSDIVKKILKVK